MEFRERLALRIYGDSTYEQIADHHPRRRRYGEEQDRGGVHVNEVAPGAGAVMDADRCKTPDGQMYIRSPDGCPGLSA